MRTSLSQLLALVFVLAVPLGCTWETELPPEARSIHVEPSRELVIPRDAIAGGALADNGADGPFSFRHAVARLPLRTGALHRWLEQWSERLGADDGERSRAFDEQVTCRWLKLRAENRCDAVCRECAEHELVLEAAPFRLLAVVNRTDLSTMPDRAADGGEGRLVFALTTGPADDPASTTLPFSVIFEYAQAGSARTWAERWHELGTAPETDFPSRLAELTESFVGTGALAQVRSADALTGPMIFHQFEADGSELRAADVRNSPDWSRVPPAAMRAFVDEQATALDEGTALMPREWWAKSSSLATEVPPYVADLPRREAVLDGTCAGCHARSATGFHVDPSANGALSRFVADPTKPSDELRRRVEWMQLTLSR